MGGIALLARELGHEVSGSDQNTYPPMNTMLQEQGITLFDGYDPTVLDADLDIVIIGNTLSRGNPVIEHVLNAGLPYTSGPAWLSENLLRHRHVLAVSGTHGKTTTSSMLAWVLEYAGLSPGFLIGGVAENFGISARYGDSEYFVVEADEYDTAFFDKRSKFIHYLPRTLIINNIEFDHADIFSDIGDIIVEFRRLVRIVPGHGRILTHHQDENIQKVLEAGCWSGRETFAAEGDWQYHPEAPDYSRFTVTYQNQPATLVNWSLLGRHNAENALAAMAAAQHIGIRPEIVAEALASYKSVKRRMQKLAVLNGVTVYDDFAHHPTAIAATLSGLRASLKSGRIISVFEPRSNTMKMGVHRDTLASAFQDTDILLAYSPSCHHHE
jgi:UDP-N-acetylmuramate: L-alanyl-gamma-D-glutamyl-meso-diaminopimelate ligase